ncbi:hypothetical protein BLA29_000570 [Euroglyphus maynei]|uniref:Uncharacterized protein n=1 Tax=Euroglyphus maynei TaxID=6958 RepID=A0A1Y3AWJ7_EURMA|nr:hypothetical protein BLA29_000570 [Euroglyphus maynei]
MIQNKNMNVMKFIEDLSISDKSDRVSIVSIIGKSALQSCNAKATCIPEWIGQNLFNSKLQDKTLLMKDDVRLCKLMDIMM